MLKQRLKRSQRRLIKRVNRNKAKNFRLLVLLALLAITFLIIFSVVSSQLSPRPEVGSSLPNFKAYTLNGESVNSHDLKGKVILLNFWASFCPPCVKEIPTLNRLAKKFEGKDFVIIGLNLDDDVEEVKNFLKRIDIHFPVWLDREAKIQTLFSIVKIPETYLIDKNLKIVEYFPGEFDWDKKVFWDKIQNLLQN